MHSVYVEPTLSTSPPTLMQKSRIDSLKKVTGTISPTEIDSLNYEPAEDSEEFYIDMSKHSKINMQCTVYVSFKLYL